MTARDVLITLIVLAVISRLFGVPWVYGGPVGLLLLVLLILVLLGKL